jgi:hypothetical protein
MAARLPRRSFAAPFVIVSSLAACHKDPPVQPIHENPPCCIDAAVAKAALSPPPPPSPQTSQPEHRWNVQRNADGKCGALDDFSCGHIPPGQTPPPCNPPAPTPVACPPQLAKGTDSVVIVQQDKGGDCMIGSDKVICPK